ncbi:hypothetical protein [Ectopseudomonas khazarica]|uniref:hypothetical protein n=1 Tax=Ectopseudomonas khazarica TaxID=2502979 RepID=UPI0037C76D84
MNTDGAGLMFVMLFLVCCVSAFIFWVFSACHLFKTVNSFKPEMEWRGIFFSLFMSAFFTEASNVHRAKFLKAAGCFVLLVAAGFGLGLINGAFK